MIDNNFRKTFYLSFIIYHFYFSTCPKHSLVASHQVSQVHNKTHDQVNDQGEPMVRKEV